MKVSELIDFLQKQDQDMPVAYEIYSEYSTLDVKQLKIEKLCLPRPDGWIHAFRDDKPMQNYLVFPGN